MRDRKDIEAEAAKAQPKTDPTSILGGSSALNWTNPELKLILEVLLDIREQLSRGL